MTLWKEARNVCFASAAALLALPCAAHHSAAIFDAARSVTVHGTVKLFQWTNPHCWIQVLDAAPSRGPGVEWGIEMGSPSQLFRSGWRPGTLKPGDRVTIIIHPAKNGTENGLFASVVRVNGAAFASRAVETRP
ncbi:MAG: DUF6152 family protein [Steroidobacteraceae bacterium]